MQRFTNLDEEIKTGNGTQTPHVPQTPQTPEHKSHPSEPRTAEPVKQIYQ